jgi:hypothetical protein
LVKVKEVVCNFFFEHCSEKCRFSNMKDDGWGKRNQIRDIINLVVLLIPELHDSKMMTANATLVNHQ